MVENGITTCWHVDGNKGNYLTLSTKWDNFASGVKNLKLYQVVTLPPGAYELSVSTDKESGGYGSCFLMAAKGKGLPDYNEADQALGYCNLNKKLSFVVNEECEVSLGILSNQSGQTCSTIQTFTLTSKPFQLVDANGETIADHIRESLQESTAPDNTLFYDLSGRKVNNGQRRMENGQLPRGIYIHNGKKIVRK